jgi:hypothetical protein
MTTVTLKSINARYEVNEDASIADIERTEPLFFKNSHGKRETFDMYRGFLIVRHTVQFTNCKPERRTVVYIFGKSSTSGELQTLCVFHPSGIPQAKRMIDAALESGEI